MATLVAESPKSEALAMLDELLAVEKRRTSFMAFIPVLGPLLLRRSERHTDQERRKLSALSVGLTLAILGLSWELKPTPADRVASLHRRIGSEMRILGEVAERYRKEHGSYPGKATWQRFTERPDKRFLDPWGRPYGYEPHEDGFTLQTLGRDGLAGGTGQDRDVTKDYRLRPGTQSVP